MDINQYRPEAILLIAGIAVSYLAVYLPEAARPLTQFIGGLLVILAVVNFFFRLLTGAPLV